MLKFIDIIKRNKFLYGMGMLIKYRNNNEYYDLILNKSPGIFVLRGNALKKSQNIYIINIDNDKVAGYFAIIRNVLSGMYIADIMGMLPYVNITRSLYNDSDNLFEYFYEQPFKGNVDDIYEKYNCFLFERKHSQLVDNALLEKYDLVNGYDVTDMYIEKMAYIYNKYLILNKEGKLLEEKDIKALFGDNHVLGVHVRGTDFGKKVEGHPVQLSVEDYFDFVDEAMNRNIFNKIFIATDENMILNKFEEKYPKKIIAFKDVYRSEDKESIHSQIKTKGMNGYQISKEVMRDMLALSNCEGLIAGKSQVSLMARISKKANGKEFRYEKIINKGNN